MTPYDDADGLRMNIAELEALLSRHAEVSAETRVNGLTALVGAKATLRAIETVKTYTGIIRGDITGPLQTALADFSNNAELLSESLGHPPDR